MSVKSVENVRSQLLKPMSIFGSVAENGLSPEKTMFGITTVCEGVNIIFALPSKGRHGIA